MPEDITDKEKYLPEIKKTAQAVCDFIMQEATQNKLGLSMSYFFWPEQKKWDPPISEFDDIGDFLTFVCWYGVITDQKKYVDFTKDQILKWEKHFKLPCGLYFTQYNHLQPLPRKTNWQSVSLYDHQDAILGFHELFLLTQDDFYKQELLNLGEQILSYVKKYKGLVPNTVFPPLQAAVPHCSASPIVGGLFAEHLALIYEMTQTEKYLAGAQTIIEGWLNTPLFKKEKLFHTGYHPYFKTLSPYSEAELMKTNTNMAYALFQFLKISPHPAFEQALKEWLQRLESFKSQTGGYYSIFDLKNQRIQKDIINKTQNFAVLTVFIDAYLYFKQTEYLTQAEQLADFWISHLNPRTDLIPESFQDEKIAFPGAKIDQSADLSIEFLRLYDLTKKEKYLTAALQCFNALQKYFQTKDNWWYRIINAETGEPMNDNKIEKNISGGRNLTKYVGGALKFFLALYQTLSDVNITQDRTSNLMLRDR